MSIDWKWPNAIIFSVVAIVIGGLIYKSKLPPETFGVLIAWLIPSPMKAKGEDDPIVKVDSPKIEIKP